MNDTKYIDAVPRHHPVGSQWGKWDLHFHTPSSFDYHDKSISDQQIIDGLHKNAIDIVAITDHHLVDVQRIKNLQRLAGESLSVLPGIEFRTDLGGKETVHLIGIFPENCNLEDVWTKISGKLELTPGDIKNKGGDEKIYVVFRDACNVIHDLGGIVSVHAGTKTNTLETIGNKEKFKQQLKTDLARDFIDLYEVGKASDIQAYRDIVFPAIGKVIPLVICSDNHDIKQYVQKTPCWIKGDPCFATFQQLKSDPSRAYIGDVPSEVDRVAKNRTKYIAGISFEKVAGSSLPEDWFSGSVPVNAGLVGLIGNKGSGKTALAETCGLIGNCELEQEFSFLNAEKFRQPKNNKAKNFRASLTWASKLKESKLLSDPTDDSMPSTVSYIPQNYLEKICNEVSNLPGSRFDLELKSVIFSHVSEDKMLGAGSLDELLKFKTAPLLERLRQLRADLNIINAEIVSLEEEGSPGQRQLLLNLQTSKERELEEHNKIKPTEVAKPETDPAKRAVMNALSQEIGTKNASRDELAQKVKDAEATKRNATLRAAIANRVLSSIQNFKAQHETFVRNIAKDCAALGVDPKTLVTVSLHLTEVETIKTSEEAAAAEQDATIKSVNQELADLKLQVDELAEKLDAPTSAYQAYLEALRQWQAKLDEIVGDDQRPETLSHIKKRISDLATIPQLIADGEAKREAKVREILTQIKAWVEAYRELYQPVQEFIANHPLAKDKFKLDFDARIVCAGLDQQLLGRVNQGRKGTFSGVEEGKLALKQLVDSTDFDSEDEVVKFTTTLLDQFRYDYRANPKAPVALEDQLKAGNKPLDLLDTVFGLAYLSPKYQLRWSGKDLDELSPGEKGTLLLIFYLLIDKRDKPLIIDQPEENLDNQTVYDILVPCLREARNKRQVIIVTHNPNLAIVCDADQIIHCSIDKTKKNRVTYIGGAIENPTINRLTIDVLEGTRPAFDHRDSKYQE
jgi:ABC-type lipoprotein export system ATPase subunit